MRPHSGTSIPEPCVCRKTSSPIILLVYLLTLHLYIQRPDGFQIDRDCRRLMEWKPNGTMRLHPFELIQQEPGIHVRYRNDWHIGAMPERYTYDKTGQKQPLNELALDLIPGDYGRAVCNGRFRDWDTGVWYYVLDILNVMPLTEPTDSLTSFTDREPNKIYTRIARLW